MPVNGDVSTKNMKTLVSLLLLVFSENALAVFSAFAVVTPDTESEYSIKIEHSVSHDGYCKVKFNTLGYPQKHAWLILTSKKLTQQEQVLRSYIWGDDDAPSGLVVKSKIFPAKNNLENASETNIEKSFYEIILSKRITYKPYVYIDFPYPIEDGGYYYLIDLGAYCGL